MTCVQQSVTVVSFYSQIQRRTCLLTTHTTISSLSTLPVAMVTVSMTPPPPTSGACYGVSARRGPTQCRYVVARLTHVGVVLLICAHPDHVTGFVLPVRPFVRLSVCFSLNRKAKSSENFKLVWTFPSKRVTGVPIFSSKRQMWNHVRQNSKHARKLCMSRTCLFAAGRLRVM